MKRKILTPREVREALNAPDLVCAFENFVKKYMDINNPFFQRQNNRWMDEKEDKGMSKYLRFQSELNIKNPKAAGVEVYYITDTPKSHKGVCSAQRCVELLGAKLPLWQRIPILNRDLDSMPRQFDYSIGKGYIEVLVSNQATERLSIEEFEGIPVRGNFVEK